VIEMRLFDRRIRLAAAGLAIVVVFAVGFFVALEVRSVVAGPDSGPAAAPPNPGHSWSEIGDLPGTMWHSNNDGPASGLDADLLDGLDSTAFAGASHDHDGRYYTETELQTSGSASVHWGNLASVPAGFADDIDDDILGGLSCANGEIAKWDGSAWQCAADEVGAGGLSRPGFSRTAVDSPDWPGYYTSVTVGTDGLPVISYCETWNEDLKVAHCDNAACTSATITTVESAGDVGRYTSVTVGADGLPLVSYYDNTNDDLKVAHCGNAACSAGNTITTVDSVGAVGWYTSVTVGADGLPVISYWDWDNGDLKVAHCSNAACTSSTTTTVDSGGDVGGYTSLTMGMDGLPVISYYDGTNDDLKVAHCSNRFCVPYHRPR
jgi:predicted regulator of Ras-like GTPase activity (Roadblock/LC7/MglB family)